MRSSNGSYDLGFQLCGLVMLLACLLEFLLPWAKRTADPDKNLVGVFSDIYPDRNIEDMDNDSNCDEISVLDMESGGK